MKTMAVLGCGNMASAIIVGAYEKKLGLTYKTYTPSQSKAKELACKVSGSAFLKPEELPEVDALLIGCKPQQYSSFVQDFKSHIKGDPIVISILAGTTINQIQQTLNLKKVVRVMPNTPSLVAEGVSLISYADSLEADEREEVKRFFESISKVFIFSNEEDIDRYTGISGSGPAYVFEMGRIFIEKSKKWGMSEKDAKDLFIKTFSGSLSLFSQSDLSAEELRNNVTSHKGVTFEALEVFKQYHQEKMIEDALDAAFKRSIELSRI